nr:Gag-Pol polyprotein [Tanacetum cinerariifolium]
MSSQDDDWGRIDMEDLRKDHLCSACERGKSKKASHPPKLVPGSHSKMELLHMDLCDPMRVASINGKKKANVEYLYVFDSLCYPLNDRDDLGKMKPKADIAESMNTLSKEDLDNLFGPMYDEYFEKKSFDMSINLAAQQVHNKKDSSSTSSSDIEAHEAPPIVTTSKEQTSPIFLIVADEFYQQDSAELDGTTLLTDEILTLLPLVDVCACLIPYREILGDMIT